MTTVVPSVDEGRDSQPALVTSRYSSLSGAIAALRARRAGRAPLAKVLQVLGGLCLPIGIVSIIVGWYGAAHTPNVYEQNDYLISGGILGLGLIVAGGFMYFAYWLTRQLEVTKASQQQANDAYRRLEDQLGRMAESTAALTAALTDGARAGTPTARRSRPASRTTGTRLVATGNGSLVHRPDCPVVANRAGVRALSRDEVTGRRPCKICNPFND